MEMLENMKDKQALQEERIDDIAILLPLFFFFFNDTATTEIYTLSLHDALPIYPPPAPCSGSSSPASRRFTRRIDRKSTRLNSSHVEISYAVFCLKKQNKTT